MAVWAYLNHVNLKREQETWRELAGRVGLVFEPKGYVSGAYRGRNLMLDSFVYREAEGGDYVGTRISLDVDNRANISLSLQKRFLNSISMSISKNFGTPIVESGCPEIDGRFFVISRPPPIVNTLFSHEELCQKAQQTRSVYEIELTKNKLYLITEGYNKDAELLMRLLDFLSDMAEAIEQEGRLSN
jgi:hypothetical protein